MQAPKKTANVREMRSKTVTTADAGALTQDKAAVENGRKPLTARRPGIPALQAKATELYGISASGLAPIAVIEAGFQFSAAESDRELNYLRVEVLVEQAAGLLDRCREDRAQRDMLQLEKFQWQLDLDRFLRLDRLQERERQAGADTVAYERAVLETAAEQSLEEHHRNAESQLKALLEDLVNSGFNKRMSARELSAWISPYPLKDRDLTGDDALYSFDGARRSKPDHLFEAARMETDQQAWEQVFALMAERYSHMAAFEAANLRKQSRETEARFLLADIAARGERAQAARDVMWERVAQTQSPNGMLHYDERIAAIERRFAADFRDAVARITAAKRGLKELFDYDPPLPQPGTAGYFDGLEAWVRQAKTRLAQWAGADQTYVLALSLKELTRGQWEAGRSAAQWTFDIPEELFPGQTNVRLRGVTLAVAGEKEPPPPPVTAKQAAAAKPPEAQKPEGFWTARLTLPAAGTVKYASGMTHELDQKALPTTHLGRVADRDSALEPEFCGGTVLENASPIGRQWKLVLSAKSTAGAQTEKLDDVALFLRVAVRA
ncbi:MAG: hypothetical protein JO099_24775 [Acidobacteriia bacterium]|nr:hypothetical protein [Terriglobia bacterium]